MCRIYLNPFISSMNIDQYFHGRYGYLMNVSLKMSEFRYRVSPYNNTVTVNHCIKQLFAKYIMF